MRGSGLGKVRDHALRALRRVLGSEHLLTLLIAAVIGVGGAIGAIAFRYLFDHRLRELNLREHFGVQVVLILRRAEPSHATSTPQRIVPGPEDLLREGDAVLLLGAEEAIQRAMRA